MKEGLLVMRLLFFFGEDFHGGVELYKLTTKFSVQGWERRRWRSGRITAESKHCY